MMDVDGATDIQRNTLDVDGATTLNDSLRTLMATRYSTAMTQTDGSVNIDGNATVGGNLTLMALE